MNLLFAVSERKVTAMWNLIKCLQWLAKPAVSTSTEGQLSNAVFHDQYDFSSTPELFPDLRQVFLVTFCVRHSQGEMYIGHSRLCVCLSPTTFPHYCTDTDVTWGEWWGMPSSCALLGGFAIDAKVSLLWQHSAECEMSASARAGSTPGLSD